MKAKLAFMTFPAPGVFLLNLQIGDGDLLRIEISKAHLTNILIDGASVALREYSASNEGTNERAADRP